jgi:hypothetical protein
LYDSVLTCEVKPFWAHHLPSRDEERELAGFMETRSSTAFGGWALREL